MSPHSHDISGDGDRYQALVDVLEQQASQSAADRARELEEGRRQEGRQRPPYWIAGVLLLLTAWLWLFPPGLLQLDPPAGQPVQEEEEALRFAMYVQAQRLTAFRQEEGRYPSRLEEAGPPLPGMSYALLSDGLYQLTGETDRLTLTYQSDLPLADFVRADGDILSSDDSS